VTASCADAQLLLFCGNKHPLPQHPTLREALFSLFVGILNVFLCERDSVRACARARKGLFKIKK
jgi:hypothetical protein